MTRSVLAGVGSYLPEQVVTNADLAQRVDTSDEWIVARTGIRQRHIASGQETAAYMGAMAARGALADAGASLDDVDAIIVATSTPDQIFPATAVRIQAELGVHKGFAFDVSAACCGFVYALSVADSLMRTGQARGVLVIGTEVYSRILDWQDRTTCVLFGDGAGAVFLRPAQAEDGDAGIVSTHLHAEGGWADILYVDGALGHDYGGSGKLKMNGKEVFRHAVTLLADVVDEALKANGLGHDDVDWLVPHQANRRIIDAMGRKLGLSAERVVVTVDRHANTSAASIPLAFAEARKDGRIQKGQMVLLEALGGGLTWGAALVRM